MSDDSKVTSGFSGIRALERASDKIIRPGNGGPRVGLALGGGGARGLAHILALQVFDELGLKPSIIAGSSIGALMGAAYASELSAAEIRSYVLELFENKREVLRRLISAKPRKLIDLFELSPVSQAQITPEGLLDMFLPRQMAREFRFLQIPMLVVATDFYARKQIVLEKGPLFAALAASIALPTIFRPQIIGGRVLIDGGIANPLPFDLLKKRCDITVAIDVTGGPVGHEGEIPGIIDATFGATQIMQHAIIDAKLARSRPDILIRPMVDEFRVLEFFKPEQIIKAALPMKEELRLALDERITAFEKKNV